MIKLKTMLLTFIALFLLIGCGKKDGIGTINGAGASFPFPIYSELFEEYYNKTQIRVNYQSIGSGGGIKQISADTVDFGATDAFIDDEKLSQINSDKGRELLHIPVVLGGVVITYNVEGNPSLKLDGDTIAKIFMGNISKWNDPEIAASNPGATLPDANIIVVRRSDGSGTTSTFSDFLANQNQTWKNEMGVGKSLEWFKGSVGAKGNEGVTGSIIQTKNSVGYVSLNYALENNLKVADVKNNAGNYITPTVESVSLAAETDLPTDTRIALTSLKNSDANAYPISTFTWIVFYQEQNYNDRPRELATEIKNLLTWMVSDEAQNKAEPLYYAPLPQAAKEKALDIINQISFDGSRL